MISNQHRTSARLPRADTGALKTPERESSPTEGWGPSTNYDQVGLTTSVITERITSLRQRGYTVEVPEALLLLSGPDERVHGDVLYLSASDSLRNLSRIHDLKGKRILTVAGSGDFPAAFIEHGAEAVDIVDVSIPACLYSELKITGVTALNFNDFRTMFRTYASSSPSING